jgi:hypothetical protein
MVKTPTAITANLSRRRSSVGPDRAVVDVESGGGGISRAEMERMMCEGSSATRT